MNNNIVTREAREADYESVNSIYYFVYNHYRQNLPDSYKETPQKVLSRGTFLNILETKDEAIYVAESDGQIVGMVYAEVQDFDGDEITTPYHRVSVADIAVLPDYQRQGVGQKLLLAIENWARSKNISDLSVLTYVFDHKALNFYEKNGYERYSIVLHKKAKCNKSESG